MIIRNAVEAGQELANEFVAVDSLENFLGRCRVLPQVNELVMPERPLEIRITADGRKDVQLQLLAAAMARAMEIAKTENQGMNARIYAECRPNNDRLLEQLRLLGFAEDDMRLRMRRRIIGGPSTVRLPEGCAYVTDDLKDPAERRYFLERASQLFKMDHPESWLDDVSAKPNFKRLLLTARSGLAGELLCWSEAEYGVIGHVYTTPAWQRKGVASYLMEMARQYFYQFHLEEASIELRQRMTAAVRLASAVGYRRAETVMLLPGIDLDA